MSDSRKDGSEDSQFLHYYDIEGHTPLTVTIEWYGKLKCFNTATKKAGELWSLKFKGKKKALGLSAQTNRRILENLLGVETEGWPDKSIQLRVAECRGDKCIRVGGAEGMKFPGHYPSFKYIDGE